MPRPFPPQINGLGSDDWAWRKEHRYGTILCDLERGKVIDVLPDRRAESTAQWLPTHPGAEIISLVVTKQICRYQKKQQHNRERRPASY
jgi:hypothetical protein